MEDDLLVGLHVIEVVPHQLRDDNIRIISAGTNTGIAIFVGADRDTHVCRSRNENSVVRSQNHIGEKRDAVIGFE
jgi:hypothetical protein